MQSTPRASLIRWDNKVPEIAASLWIIKILSTTVGETAADFLAVDVGWGTGRTTALTAAMLISSRRSGGSSQDAWRLSSA